jgi:hypothetical protein
MLCEICRDASKRHIRTPNFTKLHTTSASPVLLRATAWFWRVPLCFPESAEANLKAISYANTLAHYIVYYSLLTIGRKREKEEIRKRRKEIMEGEMEGGRISKVSFILSCTNSMQFQLNNERHIFTKGKLS